MPDWSTELGDQLDWYWVNQLRPRLDRITDDEYFWEPVAGCWSVRPRAAALAAQVSGSGEYAAWRDGVRGLSDDGLARPCGPVEEPYAAAPMASLVLHINRELIQHGAEIALLRDLYAQRPA